MLTELLYQSASSRPDDVALVYRDERVTHADLLDRVERLAAGLAAEGIGPGDAVALLLPNDPTFVASYYAISGLGAVVVPVNPAFKQDELEFYFRQCDVRAVISDDRSAGVCERIVAAWDEPAQVIPTSDAHGQAHTLDMLMQSEPARLEPRSPDEPAVYMFSSGSTGRPKRVARTHGQLRGESEYYAWMGMTPEDKIFCTIPLFHTYGMGCCMLAATRTGATLVMLEDPNPFLLRRQRALELLEAEGATIYPGVPFNFRLMAEAPASADLSTVRLAFSAGTALPRPFFDAFLEKFGVPVRQLYGCTEAGTLTVNLDDDPVASFESVGAPVDGVEVLIEDEEGELVPHGTVGEIAVKSPGLTNGYSDMDELNRQAFRDGFFLSGDLGKLDEDGRLTITGRKKLLIEVGGYKVDPIEVEDVVIAHPKVAEAVVVGVETKVQGEELVKAVVVPNDELDERDLIGFCQQRLANFKVPQVVEFREEIPKSPLGKILRKYLI
ncbi:MAG: long-chain acyl-CoA synthetase [Thermoleophilaceae bacterium]|jgi:long-chain acyl-CoA synthetase|nr:long-chain acyl-CoA synthetase [Thermoleophilaceae bacterium]